MLKLCWTGPTGEDSVSNKVSCEIPGSILLLILWDDHNVVWSQVSSNGS